MTVCNFHQIVDSPGFSGAIDSGLVGFLPELFGMFERLLVGNAEDGKTAGVT